MNLKQRIARRRPVVGGWLTLAHPGIAEIMARAGFDWLAVDLEHSVITIREAEELIRVIDLCGCVPLVRCSANDPVQIKRVMDAGAHGVIVPMVNTRADAERAVASVYYPPRGRRGVGLARAQGYGESFAAYRRWLGNNALVIVQVEHEEAVRNLDDIFSAPGVDGFIIGPYDLTASMGIPGKFSDPRYVAALQRIRVAGRRHKLAGGIHIIEPDTAQLAQRRREGYTFLAYSLDIRMLSRACAEGIAAWRGRLRKRRTR